MDLCHVWTSLEQKLVWVDLCDAGYIVPHHQMLLFCKEVHCLMRRSCKCGSSKITTFPSCLYYACKTWAVPGAGLAVGTSIVLNVVAK